MAAFDKNKHLSAIRGILRGAFGISPSSILAQNVHPFDLLNPPPTLSSSSILVLVNPPSPDESIKIRECLLQLNATAAEIAVILPTKGRAKVKLKASECSHTFTRGVGAASFPHNSYIIARCGGSSYKTVIGMPEGANHSGPYGMGDNIFGRLTPPIKVRKRPPTPLPTPQGPLVFPMSVEDLPPIANFERADREGRGNPAPDKAQASPHRQQSPHNPYAKAEKPSGITIRAAIMDRSEEEARLEAAGVSEAEKDLRAKERKRGLTREQRAELEAYVVERQCVQEQRVDHLAKKLIDRLSAWTGTDQGKNVTPPVFVPRL